MKYRIYDKTKPDKVEKYRAKMQELYNRTKVPGKPRFICCPIVKWSGKLVVPLAVEGYPADENALGVVDSIDPPVEEII